MEGGGWGCMGAAMGAGGGRHRSGDRWGRVGTRMGERGVPWEGHWGQRWGRVGEEAGMCARMGAAGKGQKSNGGVWKGGVGDIGGDTGTCGGGGGNGDIWRRAGTGRAERGGTAAGTMRTSGGAAMGAVGTRGGSWGRLGTSLGMGMGGERGRRRDSMGARGTQGSPTFSVRWQSVRLSVRPSGDTEGTSGPAHVALPL